MNWFTRVLNVFKTTQSIENPTITEPTIVVESVVGSTTSTATTPSKTHAPNAKPRGRGRGLHRRWQILADRYPNVELEATERYGMLSSHYLEENGVKIVCKCLACRQTFDTWEKGRDHECQHEKAFRQITRRHIPRPTVSKKDQPGSAAAGGPSDRPRITPNRVGVVEDNGGSPPSSGRSDRGTKRKPGRKSNTGKV